MLSDILIIGNTKENIMNKIQSIVEALLQEKNIKFKNNNSTLIKIKKIRGSKTTLNKVVL